MQVALQQRKSGEQHDTHRIIMASMSQLDMRVHSLESQGSRTDRRVAELASLSQALTEEQRATILRLDRLEDHARSSRGHSGTSARDVSSQVAVMGGEETQRRLSHLERETRAVSTNLKLIVSIVEEAQARQNHRLHILEDYVTATNPNRSASALGAPGSFPGSLAPDSLAARAASAALPNDKMRLELSAAELRASESLRAAQDLLRRCEGGPDTAASSPRRRSPGREAPDDFGVDDLRRRLDRVSGHESPPNSSQEKIVRGSSRRAGVAQMEESLGGRATSHVFQEHRGAIQELYVRVGDLGQNLGPRADAVEARLQALAETVDELCQKRGGHGAAPSNVEMRMQDLTKKVDELREQVLSSGKVGQIDDFRAMWDEMAKKTSRSENNLELIKSRFRDLASVEDLRELSRRVDEVVRSESMKEPSIMELRSRMQTIPTTDQIEHVTRLLQGQKSLTTDVEELRSKISDISKQQMTQNQAIAALDERSLSQFTERFEARPTHEQMEVQLRDVTNAHANRIESVSTSLEVQIRDLNDSHANRIQSVSSSLEAHDDLILQMGRRLDALVLHQTRLHAESGSEETKALQERLEQTNSELEKHREQTQKLQVELEGLSGDVKSITASHADSTAVLHTHVSDLLNSRKQSLETMFDLRVQLGSMQNIEEQRAACVDSSMAKLMDDLSARVESLSAEVKSKITSNADAISDLMASKSQSADAIAELRVRLGAKIDAGMQLDVLQSERELGMVEPSPERLETLGARLESLARDVQVIGSSNADASVAMHARISEISVSRTEHADAIAALQTQVKGLQGLENVIEEREKRLEAKLAESLSVHVKALSEERWDTVAVERMPTQAYDLTAECSSLRQECDTLHDIVDGRVLVSLQTLEAQLPEALQKVERLLAEQSDRFAKIEENDVRLSLTQTRLGVCEQKVQDCMVRLEKVPTVSQMRMHWQEDVHRLLHDLNADGLQKRIDLSIDAIEELNSQQQRTMAQVRSLMQGFDEDSFHKSVATTPQNCCDKIGVTETTIVQSYLMNQHVRDAVAKTFNEISTVIEETSVPNTMGDDMVPEPPAGEEIDIKEAN